MQRRSFLKAAATGGAALFTSGASPSLAAFLRVVPARAAGASDATIEVLADEAIGTIPPEIYGHFVEHLGGVVYDGIWVGEHSKIPNVGGIRKALLDALARIRPAVVRWPGGCFADSYNWRDGIGPRAQRPRRANFWLDDTAWPTGCPDGPWKYDTNDFGTDDFARFCRLVGAQPYFAANLRSASARDFYDWVDYCNAPAGTTTLAATRAAAGERDPYRVRYWGVGNESWGCGGNFRPEEYASEYRRFVEWVPRLGEALRFVASGPNGGDLEWTRRFFASMAERRAIGGLWGWALHHYSWNVSAGKTTDWKQGKGAATGYPVDEWYELLSEAARIEGLIRDHWAAIGEIDRQHQVKLVVDEWGAWYRSGTEADVTHLYGQQSTIRDAVLAGQSLDTFNRHVDKVAMANVAQLVNCLQSLFLAHEDRFLVTPTYHVFDMYQAHQGARALRTEFAVPPAWHQGATRSVTLPGLSGSASLRDRRLTLTVTNPDLGRPREAVISVRGARVTAGTATTLAAAGIQDVNTFEAPGRVQPRDAPVAAPRDGKLAHTFPPASVTRLQLELQ
jgi:alpha-L-arabinofuranosidase